MWLEVSVYSFSYLLFYLMEIVCAVEADELRSLRVRVAGSGNACDKRMYCSQIVKRKVPCKCQFSRRRRRSVVENIVF